MQSAKALGSDVELRLRAPSETEAGEWFAELWKDVAEFENHFSRFNPNSELSIFNSRAGEKIPVSKEFRMLLVEMLRFAVLTDGLFNPFILPNLQRAGYRLSMTDSREDAPDYAARKMTNHTELDLGEDWARIPANTAIDAGGIGKGYLADRLAERLREKTENYCLSLGGDMAIGGVDENGSWTIGIQSAQDRSADIAVFSGQRPSYGIATSGILREKNNTTQVHLIDPRTGAPAPASKNICTVAAPNATAADVMASCILIDGKNLAESLIGKGLIDAVLLQEIEHKPIVIGKGFTFQENFPSTS